MIRLGWFSTGRGPGSRNLLQTALNGIEGGTLDASMSFVFCNWDNTEDPNPKRGQREMFFDIVRKAGIPLEAISWKRFKAESRIDDEGLLRSEYGRAMRARLSKYDFDIGILAGYMLWIDDDTCDAYNLLNLHPALPDGPVGTWEDVIWSLMGSDAASHGAMMHLCTKEWDRGMPITYCRFSLRTDEFIPLWDGLKEKLKAMPLERIRSEEGVDEPLFKLIRERGAAMELPLILSTINLFASGGIRLESGKFLRDGRELESPYDLTDLVFSRMRSP